MLTEMDCFGVTGVGRMRSKNQDHYLIADLNKSLRVYSTSLDFDDETRLYGGSAGKLLFVADGMGGAAAGERASTIAVDQLITYILNSLSQCYRLEEHSEHDFEEHLKEALQSCQDSIRTVASQQPDARGMSTTMTMAYIVWPRAIIVHVGDSRCYFVRGDRLEQVTVDHTMADLLAGAGSMSQADARRLPLGHTLWNAIGGSSDKLSVDVYKLSLARGDVLLLCTDGLHDMVPDERLREVLCARMNTEAACHKLVSLANENGGRDNITVIVAHFPSTQESVQIDCTVAEASSGEMDLRKTTVADEPVVALNTAAE